MSMLENKVCIITGGATGIGKGIATLYAKNGANLVLAARRKNLLEEAVSDLRQFGTKVDFVVTDVTNEQDVIHLFSKTLSEFGQLDILVNNSGVAAGGPIEDIDINTWLNVINVNLTGVFLCTREAMRIMKKQNQGRIINIGSISAQVPRMNSAPYTSSKHGLVGLTKSTALEGREYGISAGCLHPGNTESELLLSGIGSNKEVMMSVNEIASVALTMAALPPNANMLEAIVLPVKQKYVGRG
jgi:NAD(P)-dependent dehydrogenase (short-subunit alcohol dehydrogenase family)